jgi:hypothetical protein
MPTPTTAKWPKPKSEDEFEDMCVDFLRIRWKDPHATRNGRRGQRQDGVDIVGHPPWLKGKMAGGQCKNTDALRLGDVIAEVGTAKGFRGALGEFLVLTSGDRDAVLQGDVREHFKANPAPFQVEVLFWPDITADLSQDDALVAKHWKGFRDLDTDAYRKQAHGPRHQFASEATRAVYEIRSTMTVLCEAWRKWRTDGGTRLGAVTVALSRFEAAVVRAHAARDEVRVLWGEHVAAPLQNPEDDQRPRFRRGNARQHPARGDP